MVFIIIKSPFVVLDESVYDDLKKRLTEDIVGRRLKLDMEISDDELVVIKDMADSKQITPSKMRFMINIFKNQQNNLMVLSALFRFDAVRVAFKRKWGIHYGLDKNSSQNMVVPFTAKDVAAKDGRFGHPDVAIYLTQLHYYYSGICSLKKCVLKARFE